MEIKDYILVKDNFLTLKQISAIIRTFKDVKFNESTVITDKGPEVNTEERNVVDYGLNDKKNFSETHWVRYLTYKIVKETKNYINNFKLDFNLSNVLDLILLKYQEGGYYKRHVDSGRLIHREFSVIIMLNDDYDGGSLKFFEQENMIKEVTPKAGRIIIWPSNLLYPHQAMPVTKGTRFVLVSWLD